MSGMIFNMLRGRCPRCGSKERETIRAWNETTPDGTQYFDWDTYMCKGCGLRYDE